MIQALVISQAVLWIVVVALGLLVVALLRQIGILHERIAPVGALTLDRGPKEGESAPLMELHDLAGRLVRTGGESPQGLSTLLFFLSPTCPVCKKLLPVIKSISKTDANSLRVVFASDGERGEHERFVRSARLEGFPYLLSAELGMRYKIGKLPYAVLIDEHGVVRSKGLVNTREHLESLIEAKNMGVASIQEYLSGGRSAKP